MESDYKEHDKECDAKLEKIIIRETKSMREWVETQICICKKEIMGEVKETRGKQVVMLLILSGILIFSVTGTIKSFSKGNDVEHNTDEISDIQAEHKILKTAVAKTQKDMVKIEGYMKQQTQILRALAREHDIEVEIE